jgi:arylsulfatase A-like enzyme/Flp pilus assembly protein TadD
VRNEDVKQGCPIAVRLLSAGLLAVLALSGACRKSGGIPDASGYNLLLITLDTTRADRIGAFGDSRAQTPHLDRLARAGIRFDQARTSVPLTLPAHATLFTGREPPAHQVRNNGTYILRPEETTLAEVFKAAGFSTQALIASYVLEGKFGLNQGFDGYDDMLDIKDLSGNYRSEIPADQVYAKFLRWLENRPSNPFFCWVHFYDPHAPYQAPRRWADLFPDDSYSGEIAFMDEYIGRIVQTLDERGLLKRTIVVVAADHGEGFGEHAESGHGVFCYEEVLRVPLIFYQPNLFSGNRIVSRPVGLVDVLPTIVELYRLPPPTAVQGVSFAPLLTSDRGVAESEAGQYFESMQGMEEMNWAPLTGIIRGSFKYISLPEPELYDLQADPGERQNLYLKKNKLAKKLLLELHGQLDRIRNPIQASRRQLSNQDQASLRALGYLAASDNAPKSGPAEDPKRGIVILNRLGAVEKDIRNKDFTAAAQKLAVLRSEGMHEKLSQFYDRLYDLNRARNDHGAADSMLREAIARFPEVSRFKLLLASLLKTQGRSAEAEGIAQQLLAQDPLSTQAHVMLGEIFRSRGLASRALDHFHQASVLEPLNPKLRIELANLQFAVGQPDNALATVRALLADRWLMEVPGGAEARREAAKLLLKLGESALAEELLAELVRKNGADPASWTQLGLAQFNLGQGPQAIQSFQQALRLDPRQALALSGLGTLHLTLFRQNKNRESLKLASDFFSRAILADPQLVTAINGLGVIHLYNGDIPRAIAELQTAIRLDPTFVNAYFNLAIAQLGIGKRSEARRTLNSLKEKYHDRLSNGERSQLAALLRETEPGA